MKKLSVVLFLVLIALLAIMDIANAKPSPAALSLIQDGYDSHVSLRELSMEEKGIPGVAFCEIRHIEVDGLDPINHELRSISARSYVANFTENDPRTVLILPPTGGVTTAEEGYAYALCLMRFRVVLIDGWGFDRRGDLDWASHDREQARALTAVRHIIEAVRPTRARQIGIIGTSAGAIAAALAVGYEARIAAAAIIVGGGDVADILTRSTEKSVASVRERRMSKFGLRSPEDYRSTLRKNLVIEPLDFVGYSGSKKVWTLIADQDDMVPTDDQWKLYRAFGSQELMQYSGGHVPAVADAFVHRHRDLLGFLERNLD